MKKVLVCISNYGSDQIQYLYEVLHQYYKMKEFEFDVVLQTTEQIDLRPFSGKRIFVEVFLPAIGRGLAYQHRKVMIHLRNRYDLFIYTENDMLITEENLLAFCRETEKLPSQFICGFLRYERNRANLDDKELYLIDCHPVAGVKEATFNIHGERYISIVNKHQGCFVVTRPQLEIAIKSGGFDSPPPPSMYGLLESAASDVYLRCGLIKLISVAEIDHLIVRHLSDKYFNTDVWPWRATLPHTLSSLKDLFGINSTPLARPQNIVTSQISGVLP